MSDANCENIDEVGSHSFNTFGRCTWCNYDLRAQLAAERTAHEKTKAELNNPNMRPCPCLVPAFRHQEGCVTGERDALRARLEAAEAKLERVRNKCPDHFGERTACGQCFDSFRSHLKDTKKKRDAAEARCAALETRLENAAMRVRMALHAHGCGERAAAIAEESLRAPTQAPEGRRVFAADERIYGCANCPTMRTRDEGGTVFTVCDECWDKAHPRPSPESEG